MNKKLISIILSAIMVFSLFSVSAFAVDLYRYVGGEISKVEDGKPVILDLSYVLTNDNGAENQPLAQSGLNDKYVYIYYRSVGSEALVKCESVWTEDTELVIGPNEAGSYQFVFVRPDEFVDEAGTVFLTIDFEIIPVEEPEPERTPTDPIVDETPNDAYEILEGNYAEWTPNNDEGLTFRSEAEYDKFVCVLVDGQDVDASNYTVTEGSTIVTLSPEYLATLEEGEHTIAIVSTDGQATASFSIAAPVVLSGDTNEDNKVSIVDAKWVLQSVAGTRTLTEAQKAAADVNGDGKISIVDAKWILQAVAGTRVLGE